MTTFEERGNALVREVWSDLQRRSKQRELEKVKANPEKHRLTRLMSSGKSTSYGYWPASRRRVAKRREERISFCVSKHRNAAGAFLLWRQVDRYKMLRGKWSWYETERFDFQWSTSKAELRDLAERKAEKDKREWASECAMKLPNAPAEVRMTVDAAIRDLSLGMLGPLP